LKPAILVIFTELLHVLPIYLCDSVCKCFWSG